MPELEEFEKIFCWIWLRRSFDSFHLFSLRGPKVAWPRKFDQMLVGFLFGQQLREHYPGVLQVGAINQVANRFAQKQSADFVRAF